MRSSKPSERAIVFLEPVEELKMLKQTKIDLASKLWEQADRMDTELQLQAQKMGSYGE